MADHRSLDIIRSHNDGSGQDIQESSEEKYPENIDDERTSTVAAKSGDLPPDGGYGWVCVASVFWINAHTWGINSVGVASPDIAFEDANMCCRATACSLLTISLTMYSPTPRHLCMPSLVA
jgi:hypothetical protein